MRDEVDSEEKSEMNERMFQSDDSQTRRLRNVQTLPITFARNLTDERIPTEGSNGAHKQGGAFDSHHGERT